MKKSLLTKGKVALLTVGIITAIFTGTITHNSRIERKEMIPTIKTFSTLLDALGYELRIVKKGNA